MPKFGDWSAEQVVQRHVNDFLWLAREGGWRNAYAEVFPALSRDVRGYRAPRRLAIFRMFHVLKRFTTEGEARELVAALPEAGEAEPVVQPATPAPATPGPSPALLAISGFRGPKDNTPRPCRVTWERLAARLQDVRTYPDKDRCPLWSPARFLGDRRGSEHVVDVSCLVLDFDDGTHWDAVLPRWKGIAAVVHTSWSHTWTHPKWRLVMPLEQPVPAAAWSGVWGWASARVDGKNDTKCKDAGRLYFVPARPPDAPYQAMRIEGRPLDLPDSVLRPPAPPTRLPPRVPRPRGRRSEVFKTDAGARRDLGVALGGQLVAGETQVKGVKCPACGRPSLTWYVPIGPALKATCNHRNSCAASYWLDELAA